MELGFKRSAQDPVRRVLLLRSSNASSPAANAQVLASRMCSFGHISNTSVCASIHLSPLVAIQTIVQLQFRLAIKN